VLEYAAGLAAWFSKAKTNGLVPVAYTPRKYLRKSKTMAPGQVMVEREEVILIEPLEPPQAN
jgi:predicted ribosome quality control (RQC) complex YloA/Tae2 family protein